MCVKEEINTFINEVEDLVSKIRTEIKKEDMNQYGDVDSLLVKICVAAKMVRESLWKERGIFDEFNGSI